MTERCVTNERDALERLDGVPYVLFAAHQSAKHFWTLVCKKYPELRGVR